MGPSQPGFLPGFPRWDRPSSPNPPLPRSSQKSLPDLPPANLQPSRVCCPRSWLPAFPSLGKGAPSSSGGSVFRCCAPRFLSSCSICDGLSCLAGARRPASSFPSGQTLSSPSLCFSPAAQLLGPPGGCCSVLPSEEMVLSPMSTPTTPLKLLAHVSGASVTLNPKAAFAPHFP